MAETGMQGARITGSRGTDRRESGSSRPGHLVVVGASAGGLEPLLALARALPASVDAAMLVVNHSTERGNAALPWLLGRIGSLPAVAATDGHPIRRGQIVVAVPDRHLLVEGDVVRVSDGPRVAHWRPSVDALFRSAAATAGPRAIAVILSGMLYDGTAGAVAVRDAGGLVIVQDPTEAAHPPMPRSVMQRVQPDHVATAAELGPLLTRIASISVRALPTMGTPSAGDVVSSQPG